MPFHFPAISGNVVGQTTCRAQCDRRAWGSRRGNGRRDSVRCRADQIISRATVSRFCNSQPGPSVELAPQHVAAPERDVVSASSKPGPVADDAHVAAPSGCAASWSCRPRRAWPALSGSKSACTGGTANVSGMPSPPPRPRRGRRPCRRPALRAGCSTPADWPRAGRSTSPRRPPTGRAASSGPAASTVTPPIM